MRLKVESRKTLQDSTVMEIAREYVCVCLSVTTVDISLEIQLKKAVTDDNSDVNSNKQRQLEDHLAHSLPASRLQRHRSPQLHKGRVHRLKKNFQNDTVANNAKNYTQSGQTGDN